MMKTPNLFYLRCDKNEKREFLEIGIGNNNVKNHKVFVRKYKIRVKSSLFDVFIPFLYLNF